MSWSGKDAKRYSSPNEARLGAIDLFMKDNSTESVDIYAYTKDRCDLCGVVFKRVGGYTFHTVKWSKTGAFSRGMERMILRDGSLKR